ncbi:MAG: hypothetical protein H7Y05_14970 [Steroidobacteraceae bacterium]|nr:hypothetical protein [Deltaproteobacteria bacterium]
MKRFINLLLMFSLFACAALANAETVTTRAQEHGYFELTARDASGQLLWSESARNALADEGEQALLDIYLRGATPPAGFYVRLYNDTPAETDTLALLTGEPSGSGYAPIAVERSAVGWPTLALDTGDYMATSKEITFTAAGGSIGPVTYAVLATSSDNTGKLISYAALSQSRTLAVGESLKITYKVKQQ